MDDQITLRVFKEEDLPFLDRICIDQDAIGPFEWAGFQDVRARRRRWEADGYVGADSSALAVALPDGTVIGIASWEAKDRGGPAGGCYEIGMALLPEHRGRGFGTAGQRLLVRHLFAYTFARRLEAQTDAENIAEQKVLERIGFRREGLLRDVRFRHGVWRDMVIYGLLRDELPASPGTGSDRAPNPVDGLSGTG
ncbi:GNAT family protein [Actinoplanes sp. NPDC049118]|uniref:GNAT family N-acetyltransferase n=1 Tax=Actinoplanes sp. NPDC049118 TaxID=3155769 RepID=UPI00340AAC2F